MNEPGDDHLSRAQTELGEPDALFQISRGRFYAKLWAGLGMIALAVVVGFLWWTIGIRFDPLLAKLMLTPPVLGVLILVHMYRQRGLVVLIYPTGMLRLRRGEVDSFPWSDILEVRIKLQRAEAAEIIRNDDGHITSCWLPTEVPTIQIWKAWLTVERADGTEAHFGPALADYDRLAEEIQGRTFPFMWASVWKRFQEGYMLPFGDLELNLIGVHRAGKRLPWREVKEITIAQGRLTLKKAGKWLPWAVVDASKVPNLHVLFALVEEARKFRAAPAPATSQPHDGDADHKPGGWQD